MYRFNWRHYVHKIYTTSHTISLADPKPSSLSTSTNKDNRVQSSFEKKINKDILLLMQQYWTLSDVLALILVNNYFKSFFYDQSPKLLKQWQSLRITDQSVRNLQVKISDWSRFNALSKLQYFVHHLYHKKATQFKTLPTTNVFFYEGYYFIMSKHEKLKVVAFCPDPTMTEDTYKFSF